MATADVVDSNLITTTKFTLNNGYAMPAVGFGTFRIKSAEEILSVVDEALAAGYRMFDTAAVYHNETHLKKAFQTLLPKHGLEREDIFVTTKLSTSDHGTKDIVKRAYKTSRDNLGLEYVDLYLIHFPGTAKMSCKDSRNIDIRHRNWEALVELYDEGLVNAIGVSNFTVRHLEELMNSNHGVVPAVNQVEWHPFYHQPELLDFCRQNDIMLQAYSSLGGTSVDNDVLIKHPTVTKIAQQLDVTNAQVLLAWALQQEVAVIPKSTHPLRIRQNIALNFKIPEPDMQALSALGRYKCKYAWDPTVVA